MSTSDEPRRRRSQCLHTPQNFHLLRYEVPWILLWNVDSTRLIPISEFHLDFVSRWQKTLHAKLRSNYIHWQPSVPGPGKEWDLNNKMCPLKGLSFDNLSLAPSSRHHHGWSWKKWSITLAIGATAWTTIFLTSHPLPKQMGKVAVKAFEHISDIRHLNLLQCVHSRSYGRIFRYHDTGYFWHWC